MAERQFKYRRDRTWAEGPEDYLAFDGEVKIGRVHRHCPSSLHLHRRHTPLGPDHRGTGADELAPATVGEEISSLSYAARAPAHLPREAAYQLTLSPILPSTPRRRRRTSFDSPHCRRAMRWRSSAGWR